MSAGDWSHKDPTLGKITHEGGVGPWCTRRGDYQKGSRWATYLPPVASYTEPPYRHLSAALPRPRHSPSLILCRK